MNLADMPDLKPLPVKSPGERRKWIVTKDWTCRILGNYQLFIIPKGFIFDGASIPKPFWPLLSPTGYLFLAGLIHDFVYKYGFLFEHSVAGDVVGPIYKSHPYSQKEADIILADIADGICMGHHWKTSAAFLALRGFGFFTWDKYRKQNPKCDIFPADYKGEKT